jgi:hypothetical protein
MARGFEPRVFRFSQLEITHFFLLPMKARTFLPMKRLKRDRGNCVRAEARAAALGGG